MDILNIKLDYFINLNGSLFPKEGKIKLEGVDLRNNTIVAVKIDSSKLKVLRHDVSILNYLYRDGVSSIPKIFWYGNI